MTLKDELNDAVGRLEQALAELRAESGAEALELRARVRALESRLEELGSNSASTARRAPRQKTGRPKQRAAGAQASTPKQKKGRPKQRAPRAQRRRTSST